MKIFTLDRFKLVYWVIAIATAQHTAWGAATTMQGTQPTDGMQLIGWWIQGMFFAIAIDYTMVMVATKIRSGTTASQFINLRVVRIPINWYTIAFLFVAIGSSYFQLLYAWVHSMQLQMGTGVTAIWQTRLSSLIDARVVFAPLLLPAIATIYTFGGFGKGGEAQSKQRNVAQPSQSSRNLTVNDAILIEREQSQPRNLLSFPQPQQIRGDDGKLTGYICPGCNVELSISGWSRHKRTCEYLQVSIGGIQ